MECYLELGLDAHLYQEPGSPDKITVAVKKLKSTASVNNERLKRVRKFDSVPSQPLTSTTVQRVLREVFVWLNLHHPHIMEFVGFHLTLNDNEAEAWFVSMWKDQGSVDKYLRNGNYEPLDPE